MFGLGTVSMSSSDTSTPQSSIESISASKAKELREEIRNLVEELRDRKRVREIDYA
jgi:membrane protein YdbS with pleckstrin-like domain